MIEQQLPEALTLKSNDEVNAFLEYDSHDLTSDEIELLEEADKFYKAQCED